jgi:hypothetical protein
VFVIGESVCANITNIRDGDGMKGGKKSKCNKDDKDIWDFWLEDT